MEVLGYATMGERFLAFLCDASVETVLAGTFLALFYLRSSLGFERLEQIVVWIIPIAYMTLAEFFFHGTIGKRLLRIQLLSDSPECRYPTLRQILLRESLGKFLSGLVLGIGFLAGVGNRKKKTWADQIGRTVVVRTGAVSAPVKAVLIVILICSYVGFALALKAIPATYKKNLLHQQRAAELKIDKVHEQIFGAFFADEPNSINEYQRAMTNLSPLLDQYDNLLEREQELDAQTRKLLTNQDFYDRFQLDIYEKIIPLRQEIAKLVRSHMQMVLAFDPRTQTWDQILQARIELKAQINKRNNWINRLGQNTIPRTIEFN